MNWVSYSGMFRDLTSEEIKQFQEYAQKNDPPDPVDISHWGICHPVCRDVWIERGIFPNGLQLPLEAEGEYIEGDISSLIHLPHAALIYRRGI